MIYLFEYQLSGIFRNAVPLVNELKAFPGWAQCFDRTWLIATHDDIRTVEQRLLGHLMPTDRTFLVPIHNSVDFAGRLPQEIWNWINDSRSAGF